MEDLQKTIQAILSDPAQMAQLQQMAAALGLQPEPQAEQPQEAGPEQPPSPGQVTPDGQIAAMMARLGTMTGSEERVFSALRSSLSERGRRKADRALTAARLSRLAGMLLASGHGNHV